MGSNVSETQSTDREEEIHAWLTSAVGADYRMAPASGDASFRRYLRIFRKTSTLILMDAPPGYEDCRPFVHAQRLLRGAGVNVPEIIDADLDRGLLLLGDLGRRSYLDALNGQNCEALYADALSSLERMQTGIPADQVTVYDQNKLNEELQLFPDWFLKKHLSIEITDSLRQILENSFVKLIALCLEQPQVFVHRDYHSRNLMLVKSNNPGVLDFQDAVRGPATYDLVSLFRDAYIAWPAARVDAWVRGYLHRIRVELDALAKVDASQFVRWFDLTGVQRHIKVAGIFCRLWYRDRKPGYLRDIPLTLRYLTEIGAKYAETRAMADALRALDVETRLDFANARVFAGEDK
ncbi:MAG TPA: phosphotransferase [Gammaproteobacteria bacterium]